MTDTKKSTPNKTVKKTKSPIHLAISKNSKILALFAIACTVIVGLVNELTRDEIKTQQQKELLKTLHTIIEPSSYDNDIANDCIVMSSPVLGSSNMQTAYIARKSDKVVAVAITSIAPDGYNGNIKLIVGINIDNSISNVRVLKHQETPGLGDKIDDRKDDWIKSFSNKKMLTENDNRWAVVKDNGMFDQFTGATITPRAVVKAVKNTLIYFTENKTSLLTRPNACAISSKPTNQNINNKSEEMED